jgi:hypothetical protein
MLVGTAIAAIAGVLLVVAILWDAFETILVPRRISRAIRFTRLFYLWTWRGWRALAGGIRTPSRREGLLGLYAPLSLLLLLVCWAAGLIAAFALLQFAVARGTPVAHPHFRTLLYLSGETFFTLGYGDITPTSAAGRVLSVIESGLGFGFLGTVIGYLPTIYTTFSHRELEITLLDARAGSPPTAAEFVRRMSVFAEKGLPESLLRDWERWCAQVLETHISYPLLAYYRSQHGNQSWLGALTTILDSSALILAGIEGIRPDQAQLTFAMARHALVDVAQIFVPRYTPGAPDRLPPSELARLREHLAGTTMGIPDAAEFEARLLELRREYEPYAQALAAHLLIELPPWIHSAPRRDNWSSGPWDKALGFRPAAALWDDDHF